MTYKFINLPHQADVDNEKVRYISKEAANFAKENRIYYFETSSLWSRTEYNYNGNYQAKGIENILIDVVEGN